MISGKVDPIRRDLDVMFAAALGPAARSKMLADTAARVFAETDAAIEGKLDTGVPHHTFVDGAATDQLARVKPDGVIVRTYEILPFLITAVGRDLWKNSPVLSGAYQEHHILLADGNEIARVDGDGWTAPVLPEKAREFAFVNSMQYARLIEPDDRTGRKGESKAHRDGVYHVVAATRRREFLAVANVSFAWRELAGAEETKPEKRSHPGRALRNPAIIIVPK
jgi:hypothetical protein